jgi:hypothetical protein
VAGSLEKGKFMSLTDEKYQEAVAAFAETGNKQRAADKLGIAVNTLKYRLKQAALAGYAPEAQLNHPVATGFVLKGYSHLTKTETGENIWLKTEAMRERWADGIISAIDGARNIWTDSVPPMPQLADTDVVPWLQIGDAHIGMLASEKETGANFDISIAEREICAAAATLIDECPPCEVMVINDLGDGTHYENFKAMTEASGHQVDFDTRYWKMIEAYVRINKFIITKALTKARRVDVIYNQGNHSRTNDIWIAALVKEAYWAQDRVNVLDNKKTMLGYRMGNTLVLIHHGDKMRPERFAAAGVTDYSVDWGETQFRYLDGGHVHHSQRKELPGCFFESWNNLAPADKHAHDAGYRSKQFMSLVKRSRTYGDTGRSTISIERVRDIIRVKDPEHYSPPQMRAFAA